MILDWKQIGININTEEDMVDVYVDGVRYPGSALAAPIRLSYEKGELRLKVTIWAGKGSESDT
jgi:2-phospho-L-lactate guanylyltransferase (CobY/MobA/RfbA family)